MWTQHRYQALSERFYAPVTLTPCAEPSLLLLNEALAEDLNLDAEWLRSAEAVSCLAGNTALDGAEPAALAYAGHQFGNFVPSLGDGRALLLGEAISSDGRPVEIQLKGSGPTRFSRGGDGRAPLEAVLREYIFSEAMHALAIPTTRTLAVISTGERVLRETMQPGAVLVRVAESHVRVGTFQFFAARGDHEALRLLVDDVVERSYPELRPLEGRERVLALLRAVCGRQARLVARWMGVGFIHGVMNTDNIALSGETIDYGPTAFLDPYSPAAVFSSIDRRGRYAYGNQPGMAAWGMARLAETLLPLIAADADEATAAAQAVLDGFADAFQEAYDLVFAQKLGFAAADAEVAGLSSRLLAQMSEVEADFTATFTGLNDIVAGREPELLPQLLGASPAFAAWRQEWADVRSERGMSPEASLALMQRANPRYIMRNHRVANAVETAAATGSLAGVSDLLDAARNPFEKNPKLDYLAVPPSPEERGLRTTCGT
ncbi:YdiU family protein [Rhizobiaceae bacterium BDR2-2]|uniref:Protein nucleotidyltransferase YdiU n=1 Tax=Ectorhizobium quercum TaxID=2965071 RepID=A0AAE3N3S6_9HYPH|nr:YdiU family protein [Ectorhizobium quercum]MCX8997982.1 YdiU family protein [Ectorhizobium quercum]